MGMWQLREFDVVSQSLCGVADLSQLHESDFPGSFVVIMLSRGLLTNEKKEQTGKKTSFQRHSCRTGPVGLSFNIDYILMMKYLFYNRYMSANNEYLSNMVNKFSFSV